MVGRGGFVDGGVDIEACAVVVGAADEELEVLIVFGIVDCLFEFGEGGGVDDGADEVVEGFGGPDFEVFGLGDELGFEFFGDGGGYIEAGCGTAFLAGVFERAADCVDDCVLDVGAFVDEMEVFAASLANNSGIAFVLSFGNIRGYLAVKRAEDSGATSVM